MFQDESKTCVLGGCMGGCSHNTWVSGSQVEFTLQRAGTGHLGHSSEQCDTSVTRSDGEAAMLTVDSDNLRSSKEDA